MELDATFFWVLGLFAAAAAGWWAARSLQLPRGVAFSPSSSSVPDAYFQGLNFLLNEEPDKALEVFLRMVEVDNETVETHFALGSLYRRRGEVDKAIRVHENIMARPGLSDRHRLDALLALGEDYFRAGLFDRAERLFQQLADGGIHHVAGLRHLLRIYEQQSDWEQAIEIHTRLAAVTTPEHPTALAHYHCELAQQSLQRADFDAARERLRSAREVQLNFPRATLIRAEVAIAMNDPELAMRLCQRLVELHPRLLPLALPPVVRAMRDNASGELERRFMAWIRPEPPARAELAYAGIIAGLEGEAFVAECLPDLLREDPTLGELATALTGDLASLRSEHLSQLAAALGRMFRRTQRYRCVECGFASAAHFWQCPGCRSWDAFAPVTHLDVAPRRRLA